MTSRVSRKSWCPPYHGSGTSPLPAGSRSRYRQIRGPAPRSSADAGAPSCSTPARSARRCRMPRCREVMARIRSHSPSSAARIWRARWSGTAYPASRRTRAARRSMGLPCSSSETPALSTTTSTPARAASCWRIVCAIVERQMLPVHTMRTRAGRGWVMVGFLPGRVVGRGLCAAARPRFLAAVGSPQALFTAMSGRRARLRRCGRRRAARPCGRPGWHRVRTGRKRRAG